MYNHNSVAFGLSRRHLSSFYSNYRDLDSRSSSSHRRISIAPQDNETRRNFSQRLRKCQEGGKGRFNFARRRRRRRRRRRWRLPTGRDASRRHTPGVSSRKSFYRPAERICCKLMEMMAQIWGPDEFFPRLRTHYTRAYINIFIRVHVHPLYACIAREIHYPRRMDC